MNAMMILTHKTQFENLKMDSWCYEGSSPRQRHIPDNPDKMIRTIDRRINKNTGKPETSYSYSQASEVKKYLSQFRFNRFSNDTDFWLVALPTASIFASQYFLSALGMGAYTTIGALIPIVAANTYFIRNKIGSRFLNKWNNRKLIQNAQKNDLVIDHNCHHYPILEIATNPQLLDHGFFNDLATPRHIQNNIEYFIQNKDWDSIISILSHPEMTGQFRFSSLTKVAEHLLADNSDKNHDLLINAIKSTFVYRPIPIEDWKVILSLIFEKTKHENLIPELEKKILRQLEAPTTESTTHVLPPHITPEQVARVRENLARLNIQSQVDEAIRTNSVSAAQRVGEDEINQISAILSTICTDSETTLNAAQDLIARLTPVSEAITRQQKNIELMRNQSLWGIVRRAFNRFAKPTTADFKAIDAGVASARDTSISLIKRYESLAHLGNLLSEPLSQINTAIESGLNGAVVSQNVQMVLQKTRTHALTLQGLSHQAQLMVDMLITGESNFASFARDNGIANIATGLAQTVNNMAEKNRMVTGLTAPMNDQITTSMQLFEKRLMEVQAQIAEHTAEIEKGAQLAHEFKRNVMLSLPAPEQDLGNPLDTRHGLSNERRMSIIAACAARPPAN